MRREQEKRRKESEESFIFVSTAPIGIAEFFVIE
jgi:hypothetical protein